MAKLTTGSGTVCSTDVALDRHFQVGIQFHPEFSTLWETEKKFRITLEDEKFSLRSILEENPPSYAFHRKLWAWTIEKVRKYHDAHVN